MAKKKSASPESAESGTEAVAATPRTRKFQAFDRIVVKRSALRFHEMNPRSIDPHAFKKLRDFLRKRGLVQAVQANRRTAENGHPAGQQNWLVLVGGHQRIKAMDEIVGYPASPGSDYDVPVDVCELDPGREKEVLVALNNPAMQGSWDFDLLSELITSPDVDPLAFGFDKPQLAEFIDAGILEQLFGAPAGAQAAAEAPILSDFAAIAESGREADAAARAAKTTVQTTVSIPGQDAAAQQQAAIDGMKARRQEYQQTVNADTNAASFMLTIVADTDEEKAEFLASLGLDPAMEFIPLSQFKEAMESVFQQEA